MKEAIVRRVRRRGDTYLASAKGASAVSKRCSIVVVLFCIACAPIFAQALDPTQVGNFTAQQALREVSVNKFEDGAAWSAHISLDDGIATSRLFEGGPNEENGKEFIDQESDENVLGVRVDYFRRGNTNIFVRPLRPIAIPGITKTLSVWVAGRNYNHTLKMHLLDYNGRAYTLTVGSLNFSGWKQVAIAVPPTINQAHPHYSDRQGIHFAGFSIDPDLIQTYGSYYVYFDDLRAWTDVYSLEAGANPNDPPDNW